MTDTQIMAMLKRIKTSNDGADFIQFLNDLSARNYVLWTSSRGSEFNEYHKGYAVAIDSLIKSFAKCTEER